MDITAACTDSRVVKSVTGRLEIFSAPSIQRKRVPAISVIMLSTLYKEVAASNKKRKRERKNN